MLQQQFDVIVIGGGATGMGVAVEAASRGYSTLLLEANDFGSGTSSKSTKLVHGGIRYLANLDFSLVREGLSERFYFLKNAPHIAQVQTFMIPFYSYWDKIKYRLGIYLYDFLAGDKKIGKSGFLNKIQTIAAAPGVCPEKLVGSAIYHDGQFDDTRMLISLLRTLQSLGGDARNYHQVTGFIKDAFTQKITGINVSDKLANTTYSVNAALVINATGTLADRILDLDDAKVQHKNVTAAQGTHLVFEKNIFPSTHAFVIPETVDGRVLFVVPWHDKVVVGTTDIEVKTAEISPTATDNEIDFILETLNQYTIKKVIRADIKAIFAGQRPLVKPSNTTSSAKISRKHEILLSDSGLVTIVGGKWTIYRLMGEDTINFAIKHHLLKPTKSISKELKLFGYTTEQTEYPLGVYGSEAHKIREIQEELQDYGKLHPDLPYYRAEVIYQVRYEMAKTVEDVLARRTRASFLNAEAAIDAASTVANLIASEMHRSET